MELLDGQKTKCVPHEHGDAARGRDSRPMLEPAIGHGKGSESQIRLGLAAAGADPEQVGRGPMRRVGVDDLREAFQDEGDLERTPLDAREILGRPRVRVAERPARLACFVDVSGVKALKVTSLGS